MTELNLCIGPRIGVLRVVCVKALIKAELQDSKADDRAPEVDDKAAGKRPIV